MDRSSTKFWFIYSFFLEISFDMFFLYRYATACARSDGLLLLSGGRDVHSMV